MFRHKFTLGLLILGLILAGCSSPATVGSPTDTPQPADTATLEPTEPPLPTDTPPPVPTDIEIPTEIPADTATPLPEGVLFRDDFEGSIQPEWEWENEVSDRWAITEEGWLLIIGEPPSLLGDGTQSNLLWHSLPAGDFVITVHLQTIPFENFHQSTIYIYEDQDNYIALNRGYCDICSTGGGGIYMEYKIGGNFDAYMLATDVEDLYLRLESKDDIISGYYAFTEGDWQRLGRFGNYFEFTRVGIGVSNVGSEEDVVGRFDYFEISLP
ncbi:MAG: hypothetical protein JXB38_05955 [Anaerolineales bacterium]|nr:hypothetical protein [Anaerolineales bacterium]